MSDQWDDEEDLGVAGFDDAAGKIIQQQEDEDMEEMGNYNDAIIDVDDSDRIRKALQARTSELGMEESEESRLAIEAMAERARNRAAGGSTGSDLDLSQISSGGKQDDTMSIYYEPEDDMTEEEMKEADTLGQEPFFDQMIYEVKESTFPSASNVAIKVVLLVGFAIFSSFCVIKWDATIRAFYASQGMIPTTEEIAAISENAMRMAQDLNAQSVQSAASSAAASSSSSGLTLPDLSL